MTEFSSIKEKERKRVEGLTQAYDFERRQRKYEEDQKLEAYAENGKLRASLDSMTLLAEGRTGQLAAAEERLRFRGKVTRGVFCDGCASWEQMAWEAGNEIARLEKALAADGNELDQLRKVVWNLEYSTIVCGWVIKIPH